jgi:signal peptidase I
VEGSTADDVDGGYMADFADAPFLAGSPKTHDPIEAKTSRTWVRELVETGLLALLVFLSVRASFQNFKVDGSSMSPTLSDGQFLIVNKLVYSEVDVEKLSKYVPLVSAGDDPTRHVFHGPERGDIIVLRDPATPEQDLIKRVIGLPGEKIEVFEGAVYINDQRLEEPYIEAEWGRTGDNYPAVIVPADSYFVMGDNRDNSKDSRSSQIGFIAEDLIIGRAELTYLPFNAFGLIGNGGGHLSEQDGRPRLTSDERPGETVAVAAR